MQSRQREARSGLCQTNANQANEESIMRKPLMVLGFQIGTHDGWSELEECSFIAHEFKPYPGFPIQCDDLIVDYDNGAFEVHNYEGEVIAEYEIINTMNKFLDATCNEVVSQKID
jgi:hypothetical protein